MKQEVLFRIKVTHPLSGVAMKVQKGSREVIEPVAASDDLLVFEFPVKADLAEAAPNFLGPFAQGPKAARFIYVNSGTYAGQTGTVWSRRAKLSLMSIGKEEINAVLGTPGARLETIIAGVGRDGGPVCASVKCIKWKVANE